MTQFGCDDGIGRFTPPDRCTAECRGRECGTDGCGGSCGECGGDLFCEPVSGMCLGDGDFRVSGSIDIEYMYGNVSSGKVVISGPDVVGGKDLLLNVVDGDGTLIGADYAAGDDGAFSVAVDRRPDGDEKLVILTLWAPDGEVDMAVLDPSTAGRDPGQGTFDPYAWYADVPAGGNVGPLTISVEENSGALFVFLMNRLSFDYIVAPMVEKNYDGETIRLAVFYGPWDEDFVPCTCYHGETVTYVGTMSGPKLNAKISVVDQFGYSSAWGWSVLFHEFGHYILGAYSKDDSAGGYHYLGQTLKPKFAFSEGWATFMSLVTATLWFGQEWPVYWDIQELSWFYVDFQAGLYHSAGNPTSGMVFPSVSAPTTQNLDENWVARMLYMIWDGSGTSDSPEESMTLDEMTDTISSKMFLQGGEVFTRDADLQNFLDSAICLYPEKNAALTDRVMHEFGYPYIGNPDCPDYSVNAPARPARPSILPDLAARDRAAAAGPTRMTPRTPIAPVTLFGVTIDSAIHLVQGDDGRDRR